MEKVLKIYNSFEEAEKEDIEYYKNLDPNEKIRELEMIIENYLNFINADSTQRRLQRVLEIARLPLSNSCMTPGPSPHPVLSSPR